MNLAAALLPGFDDFTSFAKLNSNNKTNICRVHSAAWCRRDDGVLLFSIRADRFLRNMVRSIVGTLVDVGRGRYTPDGFREIDVVYPPGVFRRGGGSGLFDGNEKSGMRWDK